MKAIVVKTLPMTNTQPTRLKAFISNRVTLTVPLDSSAFFPENIACKGAEDQAQFLAEHFLKNRLGWDKDNKYRLVQGTHPNGDRVFVMVHKES